MRPSMVREAGRPATNLPRLTDGRHVGLAEHVDDFVAGFGEYARFLGAQGDGLFDGFAGLPVRKVIRPTQFYSMLLSRLKDDRTMDDGVMWSAQADFVARLSDWEAETDSTWPLQRAERDALLELNVPFFTMRSDGCRLTDSAGTTVTTAGTSGLQRARDRLRDLDDRGIGWQLDVIRQTSPDLAGQAVRDIDTTAPEPVDPGVVLPKATFVAEADAIAAQLADHAIRRGPGAAWIGLGWFADSDVSQLGVLGHDLYNGACGIATFLAAHANITQNDESAALASAAVAHLRGEARSRRAPRLGRLMGIGGATGLGSLIYGLTTLSRLLGDDDLLKDAHDLAGLLSDELIAADTQLDVIAGSAGAILSLLRLYRDTRSDEVLDRAVACGTHLLAQNRIGPPGRRSWPCRTANDQVLAGMSHGAAGFGYALAALGTATGRDEFADAATECLALRTGELRCRTRHLARLPGAWTASAVAVVPRCGGYRPWPPRHDEAGRLLARCRRPRHRPGADAPRRAVGPAMPTRCAAARWAASNWFAKRARSSAVATWSGSRPSGCRPSCGPSRSPGAIAGARRCRRDSTSGCFAGWPVSATRAYARSTTRCRTCSSGNDAGTQKPEPCTSWPGFSAARPR